jgi:hypothetical protein
MFKDSPHRYNSAVYAVQSGNQYSAYVVNQAFIDDTECRNCTKHGFIDDLWTNSNTFDKLGPAECIAAYSTTIQSTRSHVLLVTNDTDFRRSGPTWITDEGVDYTLTRPYELENLINIYFYFRPYFSYTWICSGDPTNRDKVCSELLDELKSAPEWLVGGERCPSPDGCEWTQWSIQYCLSKKQNSGCKLEFSRSIIVIVACLNFGEFLFFSPSFHQDQYFLLCFEASRGCGNL